WMFAQVACCRTSQVKTSSVTPSASTLVSFLSRSTRSSLTLTFRISLRLSPSSGLALSRFLSATPAYSNLRLRRLYKTSHDEGPGRRRHFSGYDRREGRPTRHRRVRRRGPGRAVRDAALHLRRSERSHACPRLSR